MSAKKLLEFKALLFDVDRTLTDTKRNISTETLRALNELHQKGLIIGVCTGRGTPHLLNKILPLFPEDSLHITTSGSRLINSKGKVFWEESIEPETIKNLKKYIDDNKMLAVFFKNDALYTMEPIFTYLKNDPWNVIVKNLNKMNNDGVGAIYIPNPSEKDFQYIDDVNLSYKKMFDNFGNPYIDITPKGVNKATTLEEWSKQIGVSLKEVIGFGDSLNDFEFLQACGFKVAMGNSVKEIKEIADRVIGHTDDNSLAEYLKKIIQGGDL